MNYMLKSPEKKYIKIMAGPNETSLIIIEVAKCDGTSCLVPVGLVKNGTLNYFIYIEHFF